MATVGIKSNITEQTPHARYLQDGYYIHAEPVLTPQEVANAVAGMDAVRDGIYDTGRPPEGSPWKPGDDPRKLVKIELPQAASKAIMHAVGHPALGELAARVTGAKMVQVWWVQELIKPPLDPTGEFSANIGWHQDRQYWGVWEEGSHLFTAWMAMSDVTADAGPMRFVTGSNQWGLLEEGDFNEQAVEDHSKQFRLPEGALWAEEAAILPPGGVSFHHCMTLHGSGPNRSGKPRRSFAIHMRTEQSAPRDGKREGLTRFIDDFSRCPVIYGAL